MDELLIAATILLATQASGIAEAQATVPDPDLGSDLFAYCTSADLQWQSMCMGYIRGAARVWTGTRAVCAPARVTAGQLQDIVTQGLKDHPEDRKNDSGLLILKYLSGAFPCSKTPPAEPSH